MLDEACATTRSVSSIETVVVDDDVVRATSLGEDAVEGAPDESRAFVRDKDGREH